MAGNASIDDGAPEDDASDDGAPWRGGTDDSFLRTLMNVTPGLRIVVREIRRITGPRPPGP
ncbi:MAG: hypothetical protein FGM52_14280 [Mycobacterium sp.]|nr:hypothetical protein [Mycobacterium sp.]